MCNSFQKHRNGVFKLEMCDSRFFQNRTNGWNREEIDILFIFYILPFLLPWNKDHLLLYMVWYWYLETSAFIHLTCLSFFLPCQIKNTKYKHTKTQLHKYKYWYLETSAILYLTCLSPLSLGGKRGWGWHRLLFVMATNCNNWQY